MKTVFTLLFLTLLGLTASAHNTPSSFAQAQAFWQSYLLKSNLTSASSITNFPFLEEAAKLRAKSKSESSGAAARYAPEWCYTEGSIESLQNGVWTYFLEQYTYASNNSFTITVNEVSATGQFIAEARRGTGTISPEDTLVVQMQEKSNGEWKNHSYFKGFYDEALATFQPVLVKSYNYHSGPQKTGTEITSYKLYYQHPQQLSHEILLEDEGVEGGMPYYMGIQIKTYANGAFVSHRSFQKGVWEDEEKKEVTQNNGKKILTHFLSMGAGQWIPIKQIETTHNAGGQVTEEITKESNGATMVNSERKLNIYTLGRLITEEFYRVNPQQPDQWVLYKNISHTYNQIGLLEELVERRTVFAGMPLQPLQKTVFTYYGNEHKDAAREQSKTILFPVGQGWAPSTRTLYSYSGNYTSSLSEKLVNSAWQPSSWISMETDAFGNLILDLNIDYLNGLEANAFVKTMAYVQCNRVMSSPDALKNENKPGVLAYPNPFTGSFSLQINIRKNTVATVKVMTTTGQIVHELPAQKLSPGKQEIHLDAANLLAGVYVCQVQTPDGVQAIRIIKQ